MDMEMNSVIAKIPAVIAALYESIFVVSKNHDKSYHVQYTGEKLKFDNPESYDSFAAELTAYEDDILNDIENFDELQKVISKKGDHSKKIITVKTEGDYKYVFLSNMENSTSKTSERPCLLIADDSPVITKFFTKTFQNDYDILVASDGIEAIHMIENNKDKKIVGAFFDLQMPNMDGYGVLDYFSQNNLFSKIPVSVISGEDTADGISKATAYGIVDMLQKPFNADAARAIVNKTIQFSPLNKD